ncbi:protein RodZ, contains Xre-like HTH and DUF4115 domains [Meinhardsimonia xiamenensis]|jgi:cytoskeletal protein RodZ|uniref:Protein RodZ, contains Xre-like HTH and DUF4115 domains n=1 Tax=Meinhardsimonia xiamenensis TaxID=990712 RepID=A0A1G9CZZ7_9RHOB|nr:helix-turn-helix domain-containing protein [Meinhardsimonia xiamenensis]PRX38189.1 cytoskeletal protein RodZ [Meinhardsimonia xiamenensis]SDK56975.1 protein RodZ, contains Xre-like HTH and DUF4115 domains [Meinhardsimonia xiamenensis]
MIGRRSEPPVEHEVPRPKGFDDFELRIGDILRGERATLGKSLLDVQRELRIKAAYIAAIENADPSVFETPGFVAGYVRSYARYLGLDPEYVFAKFCEESGFRTSHGLSPAASRTPARARAEAAAARRARAARPRDPLAEPNTPFTPRREPFWSQLEPGAIGSMLVLVVLTLGLGYGGWWILQEIQRVRLAPVEASPGIATEIDGMLPESLERVAALEGVDRGLDIPSSADALNRLYRPPALEVPVLTPRDGPIAAVDPASTGALAGVVARPQLPQMQADAARDSAQRTPDDAVERAIADALGFAAAETDDVQVMAEAAPEVVMFAVRPSWVRVSAPDGTVLFEKILDAGERYVLPPTEEPPLLRAGNAGSVYFAIAGKTYGPAGKGPSVVKNVALAPEALREAYPVADLARDRDLAKYVEVAEAESLGAGGN